MDAQSTKAEAVPPADGNEPLANDASIKETEETGQESTSDGVLLSPQAVTFANNRQAHLLIAPAQTPAADIISALNLAQPEALLLLAGDDGLLDEAVQPHLMQLFSRGVARELVKMNSLVIDSGRQDDVAALMGRGVADRGHKTTLLGITHHTETDTLEPNHTHFVLTETEDTDDAIDLSYRLAEQLAPAAHSAVLVLAGGGETAKRQVLYAVRRNWPIIVLKESGGLANTLGDVPQQRPGFIADPDLAEIVVDGRLYFIEATGPISTFERLLEQLLSYHDKDDEMSTLELVWQRFAVYDKNANRQQKDFNSMQVAVLVLGVVGTFLALVETTFKNSFDLAANPTLWAIDQVMFYILLLIPIVITMLIAAANRFSAGNKWILLRASAESLKKEIYRYRARTEIYSDRETHQVSREIKLHRKEEMLSRKLMQTEVNVSAFKPYDGPIPPKYGAAAGDDGLGFLTPERYMTYRLDDQLAYYQNKSVQLEAQMKRLQWLIYLFGGAGTLLVAIRQELWIAFTTALVTALTTHMEYRQLENTLMRYNQTAAELVSIRSWWIALSSEEKADPTNIDKLVGQTETTIHSEHAAWVQEMQDTMAELRAEQAEANKQQQENVSVSPPAS